MLFALYILDNRGWGFVNIIRCPLTFSDFRTIGAFINFYWVFLYPFWGFLWTGHWQWDFTDRFLLFQLVWVKAILEIYACFLFIFPRFSLSKYVCNLLFLGLGFVWLGLYSVLIVLFLLLSPLFFIWDLTFWVSSLELFFLVNISFLFPF